MEPLIITLDGPSGCGKSTVAQRLAERLGLAFLDTGAMYRGLTAICLDQHIDPATEPAKVHDLARRIALHFDWEVRPPRLHVVSADGPVDVTHRLRDADVTRHVSDVASLPAVRCILVDAQRQIGRDHPRLVTEGRDQGSVVFSGARFKFYLDAVPRVRAHRRAEQIRQSGQDAVEHEILEDLIRRDLRDSSRADGPLICPSDAVRIDTSGMTLDVVLDDIARRIEGSQREGAVSQ